MIDIEILNRLNAPAAEERLENLRALLPEAGFPPVVPQYINNHIHTTYSFSPYSPTAAVYAARAEGLRECRKLMTLARAGKYNGYLLEGMACPGGCVAGAGTLLPVELAATVVGRYQNEADQNSPLESPYRSRGRDLD